MDRIINLRAIFRDSNSVDFREHGRDFAHQLIPDFSLGKRTADLRIRLSPSIRAHQAHGFRLLPVVRHVDGPWNNVQGLRISRHLSIIISQEKSPPHDAAGCVESVRKD